MNTLKKLHYFNKIDYINALRTINKYKNNLYLINIENKENKFFFKNIIINNNNNYTLINNNLEINIKKNQIKKYFTLNNEQKIIEISLDNNYTINKNINNNNFIACSL